MLTDGQEHLAKHTAHSAGIGLVPSPVIAVCRIGVAHDLRRIDQHEALQAGTERMVRTMYLLQGRGIATQYLHRLVGMTHILRDDPHQGVVVGSVAVILAGSLGIAKLPGTGNVGVGTPHPVVMAGFRFLFQEFEGLHGGIDRVLHQSGYPIQVIPVVKQSGVYKLAGRSSEREGQQTESQPNGFQWFLLHGVYRVISLRMSF